MDVKNVLEDNMGIVALWGPIVNGIWDIKTKHISLVVTAIYGVIGVGSHMVADTLSKDLLYALVPGLICLVLALVMREQVGLGDAWMMLAMGCNLKAEDMVMCAFLAIGFAGVVGLCLLVFGHKSGKYELPFVPFLAVACGIVVLGEHI